MLNIKQIVLPVITFVAALLMLLLPAIPQDLQYHEFADQRMYFGIPNFFNIISSIPYMLVGLMGCWLVIKESKLAIIKTMKHAYVLFFIGVSLICIGSGYYHLNPSNATLVWDRQPMALAFMAFFSVILAEYEYEKIAQRLFLPLILLGLTSVIYWYWTETMGQGDLRLYLLVQFLPVLLIPVMLSLLSSRFTHGHYLWLIIGCYVLAKGLELADQFIFDALGFVSGHSLKHLVSALAPYLFYQALKTRSIRNVEYHRNLHLTG